MTAKTAQQLRPPGDDARPRVARDSRGGLASGVMMARRTGAQRTGRKSIERSRVGKQKTKPRKTLRSATPRPKRAAVSAADGAEVIRTIRESSVERIGQSASRAETRVLGAPTGGHPSVPTSPTFPPPGWCWTPGGIRLSLGALTIDAERAEVEKGALKAMLSVRRGDELLYRERVNFDWVGGRDKFVRKAARALATARVTTHGALNEALLVEMGKALRTRPAKPPTGAAPETGRCVGAQPDTR